MFPRIAPGPGRPAPARRAALVSAFDSATFTSRLATRGLTALAAFSLGLALSACSDGASDAPDGADTGGGASSGTGGASGTGGLALGGTGSGGYDPGPPVCGDAALQLGEACDDGNTAPGDGCSATCDAIEAGWTCPSVGNPCYRCGNGDQEPGEVCDDGNTQSSDGCVADCSALEPPYTCPIPGQPCVLCGDGVLDLGEQCDDGNLEPTDGCTDLCRLLAGWVCPVPGGECEQCGNGVLESYEQCDDGNAFGGDGCTAECQLEAGWDCSSLGLPCSAAACGDGLTAGTETCDDANRLSGDGCSILCGLEPGYVCVGALCRPTVCGDGAVEGGETCDDGGTAPSDGCDANCQIQDGYKCVPGQACEPTVCGDGAREGTETCDDGNDDPSDGCGATCQVELGFKCPTPGESCTATTCGDGVREGAETCDDGNDDPSDGCSATCQVEDFHQCSPGQPDRCRKLVEFVRIAVFDVPVTEMQAVVYDPATRSFIGYDAAAGDGYEFCPNGDSLGQRAGSRYGITESAMDGATYDPFADRFLFVTRTPPTLHAVTRDGTKTKVLLGDGVDTTWVPGGIGVADDGSIHVTDQCGGVTNCPLYPEDDNTYRIHTYSRAAIDGALTVLGSGTVPPINSTDVRTSVAWLDTLFTVPGTGLIGIYDKVLGTPVASENYEVVFFDQALTRVTSSPIPGSLFLNGEAVHSTQGFWPSAADLGRADGGTSASDGGYLLLCPEYGGECQLFAQSCTDDLDCRNRLPGTACNLSAPVQGKGYCFPDARARDDAYRVDFEAPAQTLSVTVNDTASESCTGEPVTVTAVGAASDGGTVSVTGGGAGVTYQPAAGFCGPESFTYTADLGGSTSTATVRVLVECECGNGVVELTEQCEPSTSPACDDDCRWELVCGDSIIANGEECDDGNDISGDGCSSNCTFEARCGNGILEEGEECDDGNRSNYDACRSDCTSVRCGDGVRDVAEQCDDGNAASGDGCSALCEAEIR